MFASGSRKAEIRVLPQHRLFELPQARAWLDPQLVDEELARPPEELQRIGLAARAI